LLFVLALAGAAVLVATALGADQSVTAGGTSDVFTPKDVTVNIGDTVTWHNATDGRPHNVAFDNGQFKMPSSPSAVPWTTSFKFQSAGVFRYYCEQHGDKGGVGMAGKVTVIDPNAPKDTTPPAITKLSVKPSTFCNNKSKKCKHKGTTVTFTLSEKASVRVDATLKKKRAKAVKAFTMNGKAGKNKKAFSANGLAPGKWKLRLVATDPAKNHSQPASASFTIKK